MKKTVFLLALFLPVCSLIAQPIPVNPYPGNVSVVDQVGNDNDVDVDQYGVLNYSEVYTDGNHNKPSFVDQDGSMNTATAIQDGGDWNNFNVTQINDKTDLANLNFSYIKQTGNGNSANAYQEHAIYAPAAINGTLEAYVWQSGDYNTSNQDQKGLQNLAVVVQRGDWGEAEQNQGNSDYLAGNSYAASAIIFQTYAAFNSDAYQHQIGDFNRAGILQGTDNSVAVQGQHGPVSGNPYPNVAGIAQIDGGTGNNPWLESGNQAYQYQAYDGVSLFGNWAGVMQHGSWNYSAQTQVGGNNLSIVWQDGDSNHANVSQSNGFTPPTPLLDLPY